MSNVTSSTPTLTLPQVTLNPNVTSTSPPITTAENNLVHVITTEISNTISADKDSISPADNTDHELITVVWVTTAIVVGVGLFIMALVAASHIAHLCRRRKNKFYLHDGVARPVDENHAPENAMTLHSITINADELRDVDTGSVSMAPFVLKPHDNPGYELDCEESDISKSKSNHKNHNHNNRNQSSRGNSKSRETRKTSSHEKPPGRKESQGSKDRENRKGDKKDFKQYQGAKPKKPIERSKEVRADPNFQFDYRHYYDHTNADRNHAASAKLLRDPVRF